MATLSGGGKLFVFSGKLVPEQNGFDSHQRNYLYCGGKKNFLSRKLVVERPFKLEEFSDFSENPNFKCGSSGESGKLQVNFVRSSDSPFYSGNHSITLLATSETISELIKTDFQSDFLAFAEFSRYYRIIDAGIIPTSFY